MPFVMVFQGRHVNFCVMPYETWNFYIIVSYLRQYRRIAYVYYDSLAGIADLQDDALDLYCIHGGADLSETRAIK